jgi:hypothetical protein
MLLHFLLGNVLTTSPPFLGGKEGHIFVSTCYMNSIQQQAVCFFTYICLQYKTRSILSIGILRQLSVVKSQSFGNKKPLGGGKRSR